MLYNRAPKLLFEVPSRDCSSGLGLAVAFRVRDPQKKEAPILTEKLENAAEIGNPRIKGCIPQSPGEASFIPCQDHSFRVCLTLCVRLSVVVTAIAILLAIYANLKIEKLGNAGKLIVTRWTEEGKLTAANRGLCKACVGVGCLALYARAAQHLFPKGGGGGDVHDVHFAGSGC